MSEELKNQNNNIEKESTPEQALAKFKELYPKTMGVIRASVVERPEIFDCLDELFKNENYITKKLVKKINALHYSPVKSIDEAKKTIKFAKLYCKPFTKNYLKQKYKAEINSIKTNELKLENQAYPQKLEVF